MKMKLYSVYNGLEEQYNMPFCAKNDKMAIFLFDQWKSGLSDDKAFLKDNSALDALGVEFDTESGEISINGVGKAYPEQIVGFPREKQDKEKK